jgi:DNA-binding NarL/FixJ family response regulator
MGLHSQDRSRSEFPGNNLAASTRYRLRAVVADDSPHMLDFISSIVEIEGGVDVVGTATNGIGAIRTAQRLTPDLVILDIAMPLMNGLEAVVHIKRRLPNTKVLLVSADDNPEIVLAALACGADGFIWKGSFIMQCRKQLNLMFSGRQ